MKKLLYFLVIFTGILGLVYFFSTGSVQVDPYITSDYFKHTMARVDSLSKSEVTVNDSLLAGFSRVSITPVVNNPADDPVDGKFVAVPLAGYGARKGKSATGVHDSLFVKAVAIKSGPKLMVLIGADLLIMPPNIIDAVVPLLASKGISRDQLFFSATHSHSSIGAWGPGFIGEQFAGKENPAIQKWLANQIVMAVEKAIADLSGAKVASGDFYAGNFTRNRFIKELGTKNDDFTYVILEQKAGKKAVVGSFSAHSTTLGAGNMEFSGDYPGYWERKMEASSFDVALFAAGAIGSQSPAGKGNGFESSRYIGESLADSLIKRIPSADYSQKEAVSSVSLKIDLPQYHIRLTPKRNLTSWLSNKLMPEPLNVYFQAFRIGDLVWITAPSDFSGEYALQIKDALKSKGFRAVVSSFNGSYVGYIVPGKYFYMDEYEPKLMGWFGPTMGDYSMDLIRHISNIVIK